MAAVEGMFYRVLVSLRKLIAYFCRVSSFPIVVFASLSVLGFHIAQRVYNHPCQQHRSSIKSEDRRTHLIVLSHLFLFLLCNTIRVLLYPLVNMCF